MFKEAKPRVATVMACLAAILLVSASAGFGMMFAWQQGSQHGLTLGMLSVAMALGLELSKPFSIAAVFASCRRWHLGRAFALSILALLAVAYSLTSELTLMATVRGDQVAERAATSNSARGVAAERQRLTNELASIGTVRPSATVQAEVDGVLSSRRDLDGCEAKWLPNSNARQACITVNGLRAEKATAERREALERQLAELRAAGPATADKPADPAAHALAVYLAALGIVVPAALLTEWLVLVPVFALEVGAAFSALLVQACRGQLGREGEARVSMNPSRKPEAVDKLMDKRDAELPGPWTAAIPFAPVHTHDKGEVSKRLTAFLRGHGGQVEISLRSLAATIGASKSTLHNVVAAMAAGGRLSALAGKRGTNLRLL